MKKRSKKAKDSKEQFYSLWELAFRRKNDNPIKKNVNKRKVEKAKDLKD